MRTRIKKWLLAGLVMVLLLSIGTAWLFVRSMGQPLYRPGMVRAGENLRGPLDPPANQDLGDQWIVEPDIKLHHFSLGEGPPILVIHGGPGMPLRPPLPGLEPLTNRFTFHFFDQRGCGQSTRPFDRFSSRNYYANMTQLERTLGIGAQLADLERIRRLLKQEKITLLGHSFGALLATMYAVEFPEHVEALILVAPSGVLALPDEEEGFFELVRRHLPEAERTGYDEFLQGYLDFGALFDKSEAELAEQNTRLGGYFLRASGESIDRDEELRSGGWTVQAMYLSLGRRHDFRGHLRSVQAPALVLHGAEDILPERISRQYSDLLPKARLHVIQSGRTRAAGHAGHFC